MTHSLPTPRPAVFLDRDGVLIEDVDLVTTCDQMRILPGVPQALVHLRAAGFALVVVTNQPVVARGLASEDDVARLHAALAAHLRQFGATIDAWYFCPHHPQSNLPVWRTDCACRKPRPGMLQAAATQHQLALPNSFMVGDRLTDIAAGAAAGCRTVWVQSGKHNEPIIRTSSPLPADLQADHTCETLAGAAHWIVSQTSYAAQAA